MVKKHHKKQIAILIAFMLGFSDSVKYGTVYC